VLFERTFSVPRDDWTGRPETIVDTNFDHVNVLLHVEQSYLVGHVGIGKRYSGEEFFQHRLVFDRSSLTRWRNRMGG
jgi:hypothetical protein